MPKYNRKVQLFFFIVILQLEHPQFLLSCITYKITPESYNLIMGVFINSYIVIHIKSE